MALTDLVFLVDLGDVDGVDGLLRSLDELGRAELRGWFENRDWTTEDAEIRHNRAWIEGICAVALLPPVEAAQRVPWRWYSASRESPGVDARGAEGVAADSLGAGEANLVHLLWDADRAWVAAFAEAASRIALGPNARSANEVLSRVLRSAVVHHDLPSPTGEPFRQEWTSGAAAAEAREHWRPGLPETWPKLLRQGSFQGPGELAWVINETLSEMARDRFDPAILQQYADRLLRAGKLSMPRVARAFEELFLAGAMSRTWPVALAIADAACAVPRRPARLEVVLRMLNSHAGEAPPQDLPEHLRALAAQAGEAKAEQQARLLGAALSGVTVQEYLTRIRTAAPSMPAPAPRGLWVNPGPARPLFGSRRVPEPMDVDLNRLSRATAADRADRYLHLRDTFGDNGVVIPNDLVGADLLLRDTLLAVRRYGPDAVRTCLLEVKRERKAGPVGMALDLWASGELTVPAFWNLALRTRTWDRVLNGAATRLTFLRCCETLLRVEDEPILLSTPGYADGTLDFDHLLARLSASDSGVGPLDLVQALYRLRPTDPARAAELILPPRITVRELCDPDGRVSWDAVDRVRTWVSSGGLSQTESRPSADGARWTFSAKAAIPWRFCRSAPKEMLDGDLVADFESGSVARVLPLWPDRMLEGPLTRDPYADPGFAAVFARLSGTFGLAGHNLLIALTSRASESQHDDILDRIDVLADLMAHDRLDPTLVAEATLRRCAAGTMALPSSVNSWEAIFRAGGLSVMWPLATMIASTLCMASPKPSGLPALLRLLTAYAHEVPDPMIPKGISWLAESRGATKSHLEARTLVAALHRPNRRNAPF